MGTTASVFQIGFTLQNLNGVERFMEPATGNGLYDWDSAQSAGYPDNGANGSAGRNIPIKRGTGEFVRTNEQSLYCGGFEVTSKPPLFIGCGVSKEVTLRLYFLIDVVKNEKLV